VWGEIDTAIEQSRNVYENKINTDKLTAEKSDICGNSTWILQKNSGFDGQFALIDTFRAGRLAQSEPSSATHIINRTRIVGPRSPFGRQRSGFVPPGGAGV